MASGGLNILIADDDEGDRKQIRRALQQSGLPCECYETADIEQALAACRDRAFDCAIVDYQMPGRDGLEGIAALHAHLPFMPIIMSTGHGDEMVATEAMKRGASDYVSKAHIEPRSIRRSVDSAIEKAALLRKVAEQRNELEAFASVLVHDLSAPLASIQIFAQAIADEFGNAMIDRDEIIENCREVVSAGHRASALIDTLYSYTRADAKVEFATVEMSQVLENAERNLRQIIAGRGALVTHGPLPAVTGNAPQLIQLMQNLIGNAIKYCSADVPNVRITAQPHPDQGNWQFSVTDNGIGILDTDQRRIFEPFKRLHGAGEYEGTGLGLAICKKLVERHTGSIRCESAGPGQGATFIFTLPGAPTERASVSVIA